MKAVHKNRPNEFQNPRSVKGGIKKCDLFQREATVPKDDRHGVPEESVGDSLSEVEATNEDEF